MFCIRCIFLLKNMKRIAGKLGRIVLLHFGLVTFRFHYWKTLKPLMFMISHFSEVFTNPNTNIIYLWRHQEIQTNPIKSQNMFLEIELLEIRELDCLRLWEMFVLRI